jgi:phosphoesterase RecJ-like protein
VTDIWRAFPFARRRWPTWVLPEDNEGVIDQLRSVEGVVAAVFFEELPEQKCGSARSKDSRVNVCEICGQLRWRTPLAAGARSRTL